MARLEEAMAGNEHARSSNAAGTSSLCDEQREEQYSRSAYLQTRDAILFKVALALMALTVFPLTPLLINYSVVVRTPSEFSSTVVTLPAVDRSMFHDLGLGADLAHRNGELYVESQTEDGLAAMAGVLEGDVVAHVWQGGLLIYDRDDWVRKVAQDESFSNGHELQLVKSFLQYGNTSSSLNVNPSRVVQVRFDFYRVEVNKAPPYSEVSVVLVCKAVGAILCITLALLKDPRQLREIRLIMSVSAWKELAPACLANCVADVCEVYAAGRIPAALYSVLLRLNLLGIAGVSYVVLGRRQSPVQMSILAGLTCLVFSYAQVPDIVPLHRVWDGFGEPQDPSSVVVTSDLCMVGLACVFGRIGCVIANAILMEKPMRGSALANESVLVVQGIIFLVCSLVFTPFAFSVVYGTGWQYGLFGGGDVNFRHCSADWTKQECAEAVVWTLPQGWDIRTLGVVGCFISREFVFNISLREFSSVVRALTAASSVASTYVLSVFFLGKSFNATKFGLVIAIVLAIMQYAMAPKSEIAESSKPISSPKSAASLVSESGEVELGTARN